MSQYKFPAFTKDGIEVEVMGGWDHPLGNFFLTIFKKNLADPYDDDVLWSAMRQPGAPFKSDRNSTLRLRLILENQFGIIAPSGFWKGIEKKEGNVTINF